VGSVDAVLGCGRCRSSLLQEARRDDGKVLEDRDCINWCQCMYDKSRLQNPIFALYLLEELVVDLFCSMT
jgi:hypothetical protein